MTRPFFKFTYLSDAPGLSLYPALNIGKGMQ